MEIFAAILALSIIGFFIHLFVSKKPKTKARVVELLLVYQLVFSVGVAGLFSFIGLTFMPERAAKYIGWPTCPFQQELGNVNLGYAVLGIMCIWFRGHFWTATVIGSSIWLFGDGLGHLIDWLYFGNMTPGNSGILMYSDLLIPIALVVLLILYFKTREKRGRKV